MERSRVLYIFKRFVVAQYSRIPYMRQSDEVFDLKDGFRHKNDYF